MPSPASPAGAVWYVRPPAGGQYGPAADATLARWIREGRIIRDTHLWREGWPNWRRAGDIGDLLPAPLNPPATLSSPTVPAADVPVAEGKSGKSAADVRRARRRSAQRQWTAAMLLLLLVIVLSGILIWVLQR